jgi:hypothetical protein
MYDKFKSDLNAKRKAIYQDEQKSKGMDLIW